MPDNILTIDNLYVEDTSAAILAGVSLCVRKGERVALVGESGCGKTMTLRTLLHMLPEDVRIRSGSILFKGTDVLSLKGRKRRDLLYRQLGFVGQNTSENLHPLLKVGRQLTDFYREIRKCSRAEAMARAEKLLVSLSLDDTSRILSSYPGELSGGMRQRVSIAIALMNETGFLIADEPTSALDAAVRVQIEDLYLKIAQETHMAMLLVSHDLSFVRKLADRVYVMYAGKIVEEGLAGEIFSSPCHPYTKALIALSDISNKSRDEDLDELGGYVPRDGRDDPRCAFLSRCASSCAECTKPLEYRKLSRTHYVRCVL